MMGQKNLSVPHASLAVSLSEGKCSHSLYLPHALSLYACAAPPAESVPECQECGICRCCTRSWQSVCQGANAPSCSARRTKSIPALPHLLSLLRGYGGCPHVHPSPLTLNLPLSPAHKKEQASACPFLRYVRESVGMPSSCGRCEAKSAALPAVASRMAASVICRVWSSSPRKGSSNK